MKKSTIIVPKGIRYISNWLGFEIPNHPCIINKGLTGCGFTQYCITNDENVILCSPRKMLLENKESQHLGEVYYVQNKYDEGSAIDKDLTCLDKSLQNKTPIVKEGITVDYHINMLNSIKDYVYDCQVKNKPCKLLVTYDSFRIIKEALLSINCLNNFRIVIDEFQSIFTDSRFKSNTELEFVYHLQGIDKVCFVSATPMMDEYLEELPEFANLTYYELDWKTEGASRVIKPYINVRTICKSKSIIEYAIKIINEYLGGNGEITCILDKDNNLQHIESKEAVFYVNSVKNILDIVKKSGLRSEQVNILCAKTSENIAKIRKRLGKTFEVGVIPTKGEPHKMFTFCTRTVYLGADFYSDNARSFIFSDANVDSLAVDITLDLPQILGRQRLLSNPWKNKADLYAKLINSENRISQEEFDKIIEKKLIESKNLLKAHLQNSNSNEVQNSLSRAYKKVAAAFNYKDDYVAVNEHSGSNPQPVLNKLVMLAEKRAFHIQQLNYSDRCMVMNIINENEVNISSEALEVMEFLNEFEELNKFPDKMKLLCNRDYQGNILTYVLSQIPSEFSKYYLSLGPSRIKGYGYLRHLLEKLYKKTVNGPKPKAKVINEQLERLIYETFQTGKVYLLSDLKTLLKSLYDNLSISKSPSPSATDLSEYFEYKKTKKSIIDSEGNKVIKHALKLIKKLK